MDCTAHRLALRQTGYFSEIVLDYVEQNPKLNAFFEHPVSREGLEKAIAAREEFDTDRRLLVQILRSQYQVVPASETVNAQIEKLEAANTFAITTAHQPNIFTGYLYFVYKILHTVRLAEQAAEWFPGKQFVPVYYMGSEDADLEELGKIFLDGEKLSWDTNQKGAVGRMKPKGLDTLTHRLYGRLAVLPYGEELMDLVRRCYLESENIQTATFRLVHALFERFGVVVFIPDSPLVKRAMGDIFRDDLVFQQTSKIVQQTIDELQVRGYKVQANPREINLFYLKDQLRERIVRDGESWHVLNTDMHFTHDELMADFAAHPECYSPNVILRGLLQETLLPGIAFIGGGGELAYWLEYRELFRHYKVPFPVLVLRNSFLFIPGEISRKMDKAGITLDMLFSNEHRVVEELALKLAKQRIDISPELKAVADQYESLSKLSEQVDPTLVKHVLALREQAVSKLEALQKKIIRAEKRKHADFAGQLKAFRNMLFPRNGLQERVDNILPYYAQYGPGFIDMLYKNSSALEQHFVVLREAEESK